MAVLKVGLVYHEKFRQYDLGSSHPFKGDRFINVIRFFEEQGIFHLSHVTMLTPQPVTKQDLLMVHNEKYINLIFSLAEKSKPYDIETPVSLQILEAIQLMVGGAIEAGRAIYEGEISRAVALGNGYASGIFTQKAKAKAYIDFGL